MAEHWIDVAAADALEEDLVVGADALGRSVCLYRLADGVYATAGRCTHGEADLADGLVVDGSRIECPLHEGTFDIRSGAATSAPCTIPLERFAVRIADGRVLVNVGS